MNDNFCKDCGAPIAASDEAERQCLCCRCRVGHIAYECAKQALEKNTREWYERWKNAPFDSQLLGEILEIGLLSVQQDLALKKE